MVASRWIYNVGQATNKIIEKHKATFVAKWFSWVEGIDYEDTFFPIKIYSYIRSFLALATHMAWIIHQKDGKKTFLSGVIEEDIYTEKLKDLTTSRESCMCVDSRENCMDLRKNPTPCTPRSKYI